MNGIRYGTVVTAPDASGFAGVSFDDAARRCYADPLRFAAPWPVPASGDRVAVAVGVPQWQLLWVVGQGAPTYTYSGGD